MKRKTETKVERRNEGTWEGKCNLAEAITYLETVGVESALGTGDGHIWCWSNIHPKTAVRCHVIARLSRGVPITIVCTCNSFEWGWE